MKLWKIEYMNGYSMSKFKIVEADTVRMSRVNGDMWFCDNDDRDVDGNHVPKMILAKGSYVNVERIEREPEPMIVDFTEEIKRELKELNRNKSLINPNDKRMEFKFGEQNKENENDWI